MKFLFPLLALMLPVAAQASLEEARAFLESTYAPDRPGASVVIMREGEILHQEGYGLANVEWGIPNTPDTIFRIGSLTKQFTSAAIMLLKQRGELSISDPIVKYLPDYPTHGHHITIEHLLNHTSGIKSYTSITGYMGNPVRKDVTTAELIEIFANLPMEFAPGEKWNYNNSGYVLLGAIIEAISGQSYEDFIAENITGPLGLGSTLYGGPKLIPSRAAGYDTDEDGNIVNADFISMTQPHGGGSLLSTTRDLAQWHQALTGGAFIHDASYEIMTTPTTLNNGETFPYGYGLEVAQLRGRKVVSHGGGIHGFTCYSLWLPDEDIYAAVLTNGAPAGPDPATVAKMITAMVINDPYPERKAVELGEADMAGLVGTYSGAMFPPITLSLADGSIQLSIGGRAGDLIFAESRNLLFLKDSLDYIVVEWEGDRAVRLRYHYREGMPAEVLERMAAEDGHGKSNIGPR